MKLSKQQLKRPLPELNITSMVDIIFLLLIFFMCTTTFNSPELILPTQMPGQGKSSHNIEHDPIEISFAYHTQNVSIQCDKQPCNDFEQLKTMLTQRKSLGDLPVIISATGDVPFKYLAQALDVSYALGYEKVGYAPVK